VTFFRDLAALLRFAGFRRLFSVRLLSQGADGVFQVALVSSVLFSPERAPNALAMAGAFATVLLPFSVLGPFVGVFLDRWSRRRILVVANLVRVLVLLGVAWLVGQENVGWAFYGMVLAAFSVNRFLLAGLSASLPHVVPRDLLVTANAVSPTSGTLAYLLGLGIGGAIHAAFSSDPLVIVAGAVFYLVSALVAMTLPHLGPDLAAADAEVQEAVTHAIRGLVDAARHLPRLGRVALTVVSASRLPYGMMIVGVVLLFRHHVAPGSVPGSVTGSSPGQGIAGMAGAGIAVGASGLGFGAAAFITPSLTGRFGIRRYLIGLGLLGAVVQVVPVSLFTTWAIAVSAFGLGIVTQGIKICVDTTIQRVVGDVFRGRVFSIYDVALNAVFVLATVIAAVLLPADGRSVAVLAGASVWYLLLTGLVVRFWPRPAERPVPERVH
jgi:MFS family permease